MSLNHLYRGAPGVDGPDDCRRRTRRRAWATSGIPRPTSPQPAKCSAIRPSSPSRTGSLGRWRGRARTPAARRRRRASRPSTRGHLPPGSGRYRRRRLVLARARRFPCPSISSARTVCGIAPRLAPGLPLSESGSTLPVRGRCSTSIGRAPDRRARTRGPPPRPTKERIVRHPMLVRSPPVVLACCRPRGAPSRLSAPGKPRRRQGRRGCGPRQSQHGHRRAAGEAARRRPGHRQADPRVPPEERRLQEDRRTDERARDRREGIPAA